MYVEPDCASPPTLLLAQGEMTVTVRGHDFDPNSSLAIDFDSPFTEPPAPDPDTGATADVVATADPYGAFSQPMDVPSPVSGPREVVVLVWQQDDPARFAVTTLNVPCLPTVTLTPDCVDEGAGPVSVAVHGENFGLLHRAEIRLYAGDEELDYIDTTTTGEGRIDAAFQPREFAAGEYNVRVDTSLYGQPASQAFAVLRAPCPDVTLLEPDCGDPGSPEATYGITIAGARFLPGAGISVVFDADGSPQEFHFPDVSTDETGAIPSLAIDPWRRPERADGYPVVLRQRLRGGDVLEAEARFVVPCPVTETPTPPPTPTPPTGPTLTATPDCGPPGIIGGDERYLIDLRGSGFYPSTVYIVFDADGLAADVVPPSEFAATAAGDGTFTVTIDPPRRPYARYSIRVYQLDGDSEYNEARAAFDVPCDEPNERLQPLRADCGPEAAETTDAYLVLVRGRGFAPGRVDLVFDPAGSAETHTAVADEAGRFEQTIALDGRPEGSYTLVASQQDARGAPLTEDSSVFTVPCEPTSSFDPVITLEQSAGPPGYVVSVRGSGFPPGSAVLLSWDRGIDAGRRLPFTTDGDGSLRAAILVFHHDLLGPRELRAEPPDDPAAYPNARTSYLVVAGQGTPAVFELVEGFGVDIGQPLVGRR